MKEFDLIATYLKPLVKNAPEALGLADDAAIIPGARGEEYVVSADALIETVHFPKNAPPELLAHKILRTNLSDMAAMGATPHYYTLTAGFSKPPSAAWLKKFTSALSELNRVYRVKLIGGDTTRAPGGMCFSVTLWGTVPKGKALRRNGAKPGDAVYVSGAIGGAYLGLKNVMGDADFRAFENFYWKPEPRLTLAKKLRGVASACMDISDGLVADLEHLAKASKVGMVIEAERIPTPQTSLSKLEIITGGDDYELVFTVPKKYEKKLPKKVIKIGTCVKGKAVKLMDARGHVLRLGKKGYEHFS